MKIYFKSRIIIPLQTKGFWLTACLTLFLIQSALVACAISSNQDNGLLPAIPPENQAVILATTTSTYDSGLLDELVPIFEEETGYFVKVIAVGTGQALKLGERGDADVLLVHAPEAELVLVENGSAIDRRLIMHNDFVLVGPLTNPAGIREFDSPVDALQRISESESLFISRGDDSGTHKKEIAIWQSGDMTPQGDWYLEAGQGMGATLRIASEKKGYTLTDRATYLALKDTLDLEILLDGDASLLNLYHVMSVNPRNWPNVNAHGARAWSDFLMSKEGQELIGEFGIDRYGQPLFFPDANVEEAELLNPS